MKDNMKLSMKNYNNETAGGVKETWNVLQKDVKCCGTMDYKDWFDVNGFSQNQVPDSCCIVRSQIHIYTIVLF